MPGRESATIQCSICSEEVQCMKLHLHMKKQHGSTYAVCPVCKKTKIYKVDYLPAHMRQTHPDLVESQPQGNEIPDFTPEMPEIDEPQTYAQENVSEPMAHEEIPSRTGSSNLNLSSKFYYLFKPKVYLIDSTFCINYSDTLIRTNYYRS